MTERPVPFPILVEDLDEAQRARLYSEMSLDELWGTEAGWLNWAHQGQRAPDACADGSEWRTWVIMAGRGFGKTLAGSQWVLEQVRGFSGAEGTDADPRPLPQAGGELRIALVGATADEARRVMVEGKSGLLNVAAPWIDDWHPSRRLLRFVTGAEATLFSGASPEALRGPEHHFAWCDELAKWEKPQECWDMLQLGLRLGERPRAIVTTTPRAGPVLSGIMAAAGCVRSGGATRANPHLPPAFIGHVHDLYAGTRLARQELEGELLSDVPGALWTAELIERSRHEGARPRFEKVAIGVDPPSGDGTCGIVACAKDGAGRAYVLADHSVTGRSPEGWARAVAAAAEAHGPSAGQVLVVAEGNQGGKMVESVLRAADAGLRVRIVHASEGKSARADPVAALFEAGKAMLCGRFPKLEAELCGMTGGSGRYEGPGASPDRADAMVWALTELMLKKEKAPPRVLNW
ncbi:MAG TPA: terminase family protein [Allosphingosinicella sp.]|uniref:terminase large subunit domain-containing protein n=1 Tax=Allosphingosinicella sp. TaxID=2823234 RepID=UPI002EDA0381